MLTAILITPLIALLMTRSLLVKPYTHTHGFWVLVTRSPLHEVDHVDDAWCTDHGLVGQDGPHRLLHAELGLQRGQEWLDFLTERETGKDRGGDVRAR